MAVIGGLSFYIVKLLLSSSFSKRRFAASLFITTWISSLLTALATGIEIGFYPMVAPVGDIVITVPTMLLWYIPSGLAEAAITVPLVLSLSRITPRTLHGLNLLRGKNHEEQ